MTEWQVRGRLTRASNATFQVLLDDVLHVYKPTAGERPLWDFGAGSLGRREVAAFALTELIGWPLIPPTRWVDNGPLGPGMVQRWVHPTGSPVQLFTTGAVPTGWLPVLHGTDVDDHPVTLAHRGDQPALMRLALFDIVANNADRKGGHVLATGPDTLVGVDHGLTFHEEAKLRTVLWGFAGMPIPEVMLSDLESCARSLRDDRQLGAFLTITELSACRDRLHSLLSHRLFPVPHPARAVIPWPPL